MTKQEKYNSLPWGCVLKVAKISGVKFRSAVYRALVEGKGPHVAVVEAAADLVLLEVKTETEKKLKEIREQMQPMLSGADNNIDCFEKHSDLAPCQAEV